ncbi:MAG: hypothetical protein HY318_17790, partial [Armatimonadetes bacterium]|nr:hypothetical protein [Armatimonadota bacterium]
MIVQPDKRFRTAMVLLGIVALQAVPSKAEELYVATTGNDAWSGKLPNPNPQKNDGPFATLERAREELRKRKAVGALKGGATVFVRGGMYELPRTFKVGVEDSGTAEGPVVYRSYQKEKPILIGGRKITGFEPYKGEISKADVGAQGFKGLYFRQLFFEGQRQHLAR